MDKEIIILHDGLLDIATGRSRRETAWKNKEIPWSDLVKKFSVTHRTAETHSEYLAAKKIRQDEIKDIGGFVGGFLGSGRRKSGSVVHRQLITLDKDFGNANIWEDFTLVYGCAAASYSTHKHSQEAPRQRLIIPLDRPVFPDEYMAIGRRIAGVLGIDQFDHTTFQPERLMYWPSTSKDGHYFFDYQDGEFLSADEILATYRDWRDASEWPVSTREGDVIHKAIQKQGDPLEKPGVVGAFCRTYTIEEAIDAFLADVYDACDIPGRYTYKEGSTSAGLVVYEDKYVYSHHGTDPVSGKLCNAFDLVRLHKYGLKDEDARADTPSNKLPSYLAMCDWARSLSEIKKTIISERLSEARDDFDDDPEEAEDEDDSWISQLEVDKKDKACSTVDNIVVILENDPKLKGRLAFNEFEQRECVVKPLPWKQKGKDAGYFTDTDVANLAHYLEKAYEISSMPKIENALKVVFSRYAYNPIKDYLKSLKWDGSARVDTLLIDYLGAEDNVYTRAAIRKILVAAVARIFQPGVKFDYMLTLVGNQGIGKSSLIQKLAVEDSWYSESFSTVHGKEAQESVQGVWLAEMGELAGLKKADVESTKLFISKCFDRYRVSYGKRTENFPRQCVFFGTTNNRDFLKDPTGNRRFWPIDTAKGKPTKSLFNDLTREEVDQVWAEALVLYRKGEPLFLPVEIEAIARGVQQEFTEKDDRTGAIERYLDTPVPENWEDMELGERYRFLQGDELTAEGTVLRNRICVAEIWCELFGGHIKDLNSANTKSLHGIMQNIKGWQKASTGRFRIYGRQRSYVRVEEVLSVNAEGLEVSTLPAEVVNAKKHR